MDVSESWVKRLYGTPAADRICSSRFEPGFVYQFDRNPDYWYDVPEGFPNPVDTFVWRIIHRVWSTTKRIAMEAGEIQYGDMIHRRRTSPPLAGNRRPVSRSNDVGQALDDLLRSN